MPRRFPDFFVVILALLSALATLAFVGHAFFSSPQNPVAAEIGFEALRVARKLPLYVDPWKGAWEDGAPPSRYYVLYTPIFPWLVGKLSGASLGSIRVVGRLIAVTSWLAVQVAPVVGAPRERRRVTAIAAMLGCGIYFVSRHAASMSPDTLATALVVVGIVRAARKDGVDPISAVLLVAAPFVKPSLLGGIAGVALVHFALRRPGWIRVAVAGIATALAGAAISHVASDGAWLANISRSTGQPLTLTRWVQEMGSRCFVLGIPQVIVLWIAWKKKVTWFVVGPLAGSIAWTTFIMAKHGSGAHYWLEPTALAILAISRMPAVSRAAVWAAAAFGVMTAAVSWPQYLAEPARYRQHDESRAALDRYCVRGPHEFVVSSDLEVELALNGRISVPAWQTAFLARTGKFPADLWREDIARPEVRWLVLAIDPRAPPGTTNDERVELSPFYDILKDVTLANFDYDRQVGGFFVFRRK